MVEYAYICLHPSLLHVPEHSLHCVNSGTSPQPTLSRPMTGKVLPNASPDLKLISSKVYALFQHQQFPC